MSTVERSSMVFYILKTNELFMYRHQRNEGGLRVSSMPFYKTSLDEVDVEKKILDHLFSGLYPLDPNDKFSIQVYNKFLTFAGFKNESKLKRASLQLSLEDYDGDIVATFMYQCDDSGGSELHGEYSRIIFDKSGAVKTPIKLIVSELLNKS